MKTTSLDQKSSRKKWSFLLKVLIPGAFLIFTFYSCVSIPKLEQVPIGVISTPGVEIRGIDEGFLLTSEENWEPPFKSSRNFARQASINTGQLTSQYEYALDKLNAQRVKVKTPYLDKELYGVLALNPALKQGGPVARSYQISIPEQYVQQALNGKISVVYEYYTIDNLQRMIPNATDNNMKTWILWLSDVPF